MNLEAWITVLLLALSSSIDNFGVGISYGIRGISIGFTSNLIISIVAFIFSEVGIFCGQYISKVFPGSLANIIGAVFLCVIGLRIIILTIPRKKQIRFKKATENPSIINGFTGFLESPEKADLDQSGDISYIEAILLGIAVSMNALTNGLGAGLIRLSPFAISLSAAVFSFIAIWFGVSLGNRVVNVRIGSWTLGQFSTLLSGIILLLVALHNLT